MERDSNETEMYYFYLNVKPYMLPKTNTKKPFETWWRHHHALGMPFF